MISKTEQLNKDYYNKLYYSKAGILLSIIKNLISFDQQSKTKLNVFYSKKYLDKLKTKTPSILDYGFGYGSLLLKMPAQVKLFGCDISDQAVSNFPKVAHFFGKEVITFVPDQIDTYINDLSIDFAFCSHVLEHVPDDLSVLSDIKRKVNDNGFILINIPINEIWDDPKHVRKYSYRSFQEVANKAGLLILEEHEENNIDNYLLTHEVLRDQNYLGKFLFRLLRAILAVLPLSFTRLLNKKISKYYNSAQLICVLQKKLDVNNKS